MRGDRRSSTKPTVKLYESRRCMEKRGDTKSGDTSGTKSENGENEEECSSHDARVRLDFQ